MLPTRPRALIFDVFGTVVDWRSGVAAQARRFFAPRGIGVDPHEFADAWRGEYLPAMGRIRSGDRGYVPLDILHRENLDIVLERYGIAGAFDAAARADFARAWERLPAWRDVVPGMARLRGDRLLATCSNGSIPLMAHLARFAGLHWDSILGADIARAYKPQREVYLACCNVLQLQPEQVVMVAAHNDDLFAARSCGLRTAFVLRPGEYGPEQRTDLAPESDWDVVAADFTERDARLAAVSP